MNLTSLRQSLRQQRRQLSNDEHRLAAQQLTQRLIQTNIFKCSLHIACYWAFDNELDTQFLMQQLALAGKICYLPAANVTHKTLQFFAYSANEPLIPNRYGIAEPSPNPDKMLPPEALDLILLPVVGFDTRGNRLGTGGGYYDRTLQFMQQLLRPTKPYLLGLAYEFQKQEQLLAQTWDIALDGVMTEQNFYPAVKLALGN